MNYKRIISVFYVIAAIVIAASFTDPGDSIIQKAARQLDKWVSNYPIEKVYLQLDKPYYSAGDDIWFKAYITIGGKHQLSGLSGILNVEFIDESDSVIQHIKLPVQNGLTWGDFSLPDTLHEGNYRICAYTNYMRNAGEDYFFDQHITVVNAVSNKVFTKTTYTYATKNEREIVNALINYADAAGAPYANRKVTYSVVLNAKTIAKGKGVTDGSGNLDISFTNTLSTPLLTGIIATNLVLTKDEQVAKIIPVKAISANVDVQFFPEGGSLVNDKNTKIAFKAVGADGLGAEIKGIITDDNNNTVTSFSSQHLGMGVFKLKPRPGVSYKANVVFADGSTKTFGLQQATDKGYVLSVAMDDTNSVKIKIVAARQTLIDNPADTVSLIAEAGGQIVYAAKSTKGIGVFTASVPRSHFPSGIVQFTLLSSGGEPLNERLIFIQNPDQLKLAISTEKQTYATQQKVKIKLNAQTADGKPDIGSFSVAVTDETKVPIDENKESSILANLLLTSELRGYIEQPNYYFNHPNDQTQADLDVLMLTQGYHRFEWKEILADNFPPLVYLPEKTIDITGHITTLSGKPIAHGKVTLLSTKHGFLMIDTVTDEHGNFAFRDFVFSDSVRFVIQARTDKDHKNVKIDLDNIKTQAVTENKTAPDIQLSVNDDASVYLRSSKNFFDEKVRAGLISHSVVLKEVVIKAERPKVTHSSNLNGPGNADQVLVGDQISQGFGGNIADALIGRLLGVQVINGKFISTRGGELKVNLDGITIPDDEISTINPIDIQSVEVLRSPMYYGIYGSEAGPGGIILLTSKNGSEMKGAYLSRPAPGIITFSPIGYYKAREFYSPQYDDPKTNTAVANLRTTIYWNPNIVTDKDGNATFEYFNAGSKGTYRVVIEGLDVGGNIGRQVFRYKVE
jgi:hypothetical protein